MVTQMRNGGVEFRFFRPSAHQVCLAGDFNHWDPMRQPMVLDEEGWWTCRLDLPPGVYRFRYFCDGQWFTDFAAFGVEFSVLGLNSVLKVEEPEMLEQAPVAVPTRDPRARESIEIEDSPEPYRRSRRWQELEVAAS